ncbi:phosphoribosylanthranilate isomerase [Thermoplasma volcanium GSS1]|uniref:N-(5'-phosphoribosyl)anthranilate isomerase n=1 Tax=Thermoplasma volcanium (strain ATCC 51530 / DSM 4299 / JCM 9571 / NBRC 15438 / GSS1) TaxID=273116 RepID=TRPF_THEVO|nr:phosphoribosylanthranilate isomerase [Thermoplasma volcanium]Q979V6.1 RecName: Full=N-(5'-phosphoribosyl)anthranilate isomerase; Short=PRAI [Thermoplasma volcanium GSS1]BAB60196.1 phosphoribosylanthranilate isomerase [Thermoplasma volcanium GSS1]
MKIKVCGITRLEDAAMVTELGASIVGVVLDELSPRHASHNTIREIAEAGITVAGVYTSEQTVLSSPLFEDYVQLHFDHDPELIRSIHELGRKVISVINFNGIRDLKIKYNAYREADIILVEYKKGVSSIVSQIAPLGLNVGYAGGISDRDIENIIAAKPSIIDVSSSLESSPGIKHPGKVMSFFKKIRDAMDYVS